MVKTQTNKQSDKEKEKKTATDTETLERTVLARLVQVLFLLTVFLLALALFSYNVNDMKHIELGLSDDVVIHNFVGRLGAVVSRGLLLLFGFAAYFIVAVSFFSFLRRLLGGKTLRPAGSMYPVAFVCVIMGSAMLLGVFPDFARKKAAELNIARIPGGVVGELLCDPQNGWMTWVFNPTASGIISLVMLLSGVVILYVYDWHLLVIRFWELSRVFLGKMLGSEEEPDEQTKDERAEEKERLKQERKERRRREREERKKRREEEALKKKEAKRQQLEDEIVQKQHEQERPKRQADMFEDTDVPASQPTDESESKPLLAPSNGEFTTDTAPKPKQVSEKNGVPVNSTKKPVANYKLPSEALLDEPRDEGVSVEQDELDEKKRILQQTLDSFGIDATVGEATCGPRVTLFEVLPEPGVKVEKIRNISNNIAMELQALSLRILTPIPGQKSVGVEVPNSVASVVSLRGLMKSSDWRKTKADIPLLLGKNIRGHVVLLDLAKAPHLLIAGATGSGKSVCMNAMIMSLMFKFTPDELKMILVDPKVVEFSCYQPLPHLVVPVITETKKVPLALRWVINEMERRYRVFAKVGARNIASFNNRKKADVPMLDDDGNEIPDRMPYIVVIIDELADIMMTSKKEVETSLARIAQLSRAVGIHTIVATQRPSVNVITGVIKANYPTRVAFKVTSNVDSRTIIDGKGAENLLGRGDMLYNPPGAAALERNQGPLVEDEEIERVVNRTAEQWPQEFDMSVFAEEGAGEPGDDSTEVEGPTELSDEDEKLYQQAREIVLRDRRASTSYVQRCLRIGYNRAAMLIEMLEERGVIGPQIGSAPREILVLPGEEESLQGTACEDTTESDDNQVSNGGEGHDTTTTPVGNE